jgi:hypothetical protein
MTFDKSSRNFLMEDLILIVRGLLGEVRNPEPEAAMEPDYFESFETCYPLLNEAGEMLTEEARKMGINVEGKSRLEIAREVFSSHPARTGREGR